MNAHNWGNIRLIGIEEPIRIVEKGKQAHAEKKENKIRIDSIGYVVATAINRPSIGRSLSFRFTLPVNSDENCFLLLLLLHFVFFIQVLYVSFRSQFESIGVDRKQRHTISSTMYILLWTIQLLFHYSICLIFFLGISL